jgi:hypothetical protein
LRETLQLDSVGCGVLCAASPTLRGAHRG